MKNRKILSLLLTRAMTAALLAAPAQAADPPDAIRVSSYKGSTLEVGERSGLIIGPSGMDYTVTSSDPDTVLVEQITGFWVAVAKAEGTAEITAANRAGTARHPTEECGRTGPEHRRRGADESNHRHPGQHAYRWPAPFRGGEAVGLDGDRVYRQ